VVYEGIDGVVAPRELPDPITVSVICPTFQRANRHASLYEVFRAQTYPHRDLWILDDDTETPSPFFAQLGQKDPRVHYRHVKERLCTGYKRNALIQESTGSIIVHFDDDDWYRTSYIDSMVAKLVASNADLVKLGTWNVHRQKDGHRWTERSRSPGDMWGYGFSYVYRRHVATRIKFPNLYCGEDMMFVTALMHVGMKAVLVMDNPEWVEHLIHGSNTSRKR